MLTLTGEVLNVFQAPSGVSKDGQSYGGQHRIQVMSKTTLRNHETKVELLDLTVEDPRAFEHCVGQTVSLPVGVFSVNNRIQMFLLPGAQPGV